MGITLDFIIVTGGIILLAAFIHASIGFGFPMIATPLLAIQTDIQTAIALTLIPSILINIVSIASEGNFRGALRRFLPLALLAMVGSAVGTQILIIAHTEWFKALLALAILIYLAAEKIRFRMRWVQRYPRLSMSVFGTVAGVLGGLTNVMAPALIVYSLQSEHSKSEVVQASNLCFFLGKAAQLSLFMINGEFTAREGGLSAISLILTIVALIFGIALKRRIQAEAYTRILRWLLLGLSGALLVQVAI